MYICDEIRKLGTVPCLSEWISCMQKVLLDCNQDNCKECLQSIDELITLYNNGTYYEVTERNYSKIDEIKSGLSVLAEMNYWDNSEQNLILNTYIKSI